MCSAFAQPGCANALCDARDGTSALRTVIAVYAADRGLRTGNGRDRATSADEAVPFEEVFLPFVRAARERVRSETGAAYDRLTERAHASFERALLIRLSTFCARSLWVEFAAYRSTNASLSFGGLLFAAPGGGTRVAYTAFCRWLLAGGIEAFFGEYASAARLCATLTDIWVSATAAFLGDLRNDAAAIEHTVARGPLGSVADVRVGAGDLHGGGRSVLILTFEQGVRLVYKPRPLGLEAAFGEVVSRALRHAGTPHALRLPWCLLRPDHGWIEFIAQEPCATLGDVRDFYVRTGMLLAFVYALTGHDFHVENLIVAGAHPVLIDLEAIVKHGLDTPARIDLGYAGEDAARRRYEASVAQTGLLPLPLRIHGDRFGDFGGIGGNAPDATPLTAAFWSRPNTDQMRVDYVTAIPAVPVNAPMLKGQPHYAAEYVAEIIEGFERTYRLLQAERTRVFDDALIARLAPQRVRFLFRATNVYAQLLQRSQHPKYLRGDADRRAMFSALERAIPEAGARRGVEEVVCAELDALDRADIPIFSARADSTALDLESGRRVWHFFDRSAVDALRVRVAHLSEDDLQFQTDLIRMTLTARRAVGLTPPCEARDRVAPSTAPTPLFAGDFVAAATGIADLVAGRAIRGDGAHGWIGIRYSVVNGHVAGPLPATLFSGTAGLALFFGALARMRCDTTNRARALDALVPIRRAAAALRAAPVKADDILRFHWARQVGAAEGVAGAVYALVHLASLLDEPQLLDDAADLGTLLTLERVRGAGAACVDLLHGVAGVVLTLLSLDHARPNAGFRERALACADLLVEAAHAEAALPDTAGIALGRAGVALALLRAWRDGGADRYLHAATRLMLTGGAGGTPGSGERETAWSDGTAGMVLPHLLAPDSDRCCAPATAMLGELRAIRSGADDSLCSGAMGLVDVTWEAARTLSSADLAERAVRAGGGVLARAQRTGEFALGWGRPYPHLGLFEGIAGIGYGLLRLAHPGRLPCILAFADSSSAAGS